MKAIDIIKGGDKELSDLDIIFNLCPEELDLKLKKPQYCKKGINPTLEECEKCWAREVSE